MQASKEHLFETVGPSACDWRLIMDSMTKQQLLLFSNRKRLKVCKRNVGLTSTSMRVGIYAMKDAM